MPPTYLVKFLLHNSVKPLPPRKKKRDSRESKVM
jgi:hypothetical protein